MAKVRVATNDGEEREIDRQIACMFGTVKNVIEGAKTEPTARLMLSSDARCFFRLSLFLSLWLHCCRAGRTERERREREKEWRKASFFVSPRLTLPTHTHTCTHAHMHTRTHTLSNSITHTHLSIRFVSFIFFSFALFSLSLSLSPLSFFLLPFLSHNALPAALVYVDLHEKTREAEKTCRLSCV